MHLLAIQGNHGLQGFLFSFQTIAHRLNGGAQYLLMGQRCVSACGCDLVN